MIAANPQPQPQPTGAYSPIVGRPITLSRERIEGLLVGIGVGDALGLPVETWSAEHIAARFGRVRDFLEVSANNPFYAGKHAPLGSYSDDAQLSAAMFDAFADARGYSLKAIAARHCEAFLETRAGWGKSTVAGVRALLDGLAPDDPAFAGRLHSGTGNGIPMKIAAVAAYLAATGGGVAEMDRMVTDICSLSHRSSLAVSSGLAHVAALLYCLSRTPLDFSAEEFTETVVEAAARGRAVYPGTLGSDDITARLSQIGRMAAAGPASILRDCGGGGCYVYDSLPFSYAFFLRNPLHFEAVIETVSHGGDTDSNGALVAGLQAALLGPECLPRELSSRLLHGERLRAAAGRFAAAFSIGD